MISLRESIISSNKAGHPAYRFSLYKEDSVVSILVTAQTGAVPVWNKKKVKTLFDKLDKVYRQDIRYVFNQSSKSKDQVLTHIWCILSSCKNEDEVRKTITNLFEDEKRYSVEKIEINPDGFRPYLRIMIKSSDGFCSLSYYIHSTTIEYRYKYVK